MQKIHRHAATTWIKQLDTKKTKMDSGCRTISFNGHTIESLQQMRNTHTFLLLQKKIEQSARVRGGQVFYCQVLGKRIGPQRGSVSETQRR